MRTVISWIALILTIGITSGVAQAAPLQVSIAVAETEGMIEFSITNTSQVPVSILSWDTPFEQVLSSDVIRLERRLKQWPLLERAPYIGRKVKRAIPGADQYLTLMSGETISRDIALRDYYQINETGQWDVRFLGQIRHEQLPDNTQGIAARKAAELSVLNVQTHESNTVAISMAPTDTYRARTPAFNNCSVQQQIDIVAATELAEEYVSTAVRDLQSLSIAQRATSPRYLTWFGEYDGARFDQVSSNFRKLDTVLEKEEIRFDCGCDEVGVFAYVIPVKPYDVFLCPAFRAASIGGTDSRAGTIIHELTHFNVVAATDDHAYSQRGAQNLANTDAATAITNADSYEYFAENTPALEIRGNATAGPVEFTELALNTPVSGSLDAGSSDIYQVSGASQISLSSISGDADLYVYSDAALSAQTCSSISVTVEDMCESFVDGLVYVRVFGYSDATYTLEATGTTFAAPPASTSIPLIPGIATFGSLQQDERAVYEVTGASQVELESLTGDVDLYVFESLGFADASLVCSSAAYSSDTTIDRCTLPSASKTYYLLIIGFEASDYSLITTAAEAEPEDDDPTQTITPATGSSPAPEPGASPDTSTNPGTNPGTNASPDPASTDPPLITSDVSTRSGVGTFGWCGLSLLLLLAVWRHPIAPVINDRACTPGY